MTVSTCPLSSSCYVRNDDCIEEEKIGTVTDSEDVMDSEGQGEESANEEISDEEEMSDEEEGTEDSEDEETGEEDSEDEELEGEEAEKEEDEESDDSESEDSEDSDAEDSEVEELLNEIKEISSKLEALDAGVETVEIEAPRCEKKNKKSSKVNSQKEQKPSSPKQDKEGLSSPMMIWLAIVFAIGLLATYLPTNVYETTRFRGYETKPAEFMAWKEEMNKEAYLLDSATKIYEAKKKLEKMPFWEKLRTNRWTPLPSKFQGLQWYLDRYGFTGKATEEFMYRAKPRFPESQKDGKKIHVNFEIDGLSLPNTLKFEEVQLTDGGELWITETLRGHKVRRVYFITTEDLLAL